MILIYITISIVIACLILSFNFIYKNKKETYSNFNIDKSQLINENSIRFSKDKPYNDQRGAFAFKDSNYFFENKDEIFKHYNTDKRIIKFFNDNYNKPFEIKTDKPLEDSDFKKRETTKNEVGLGYDKKTNSSKIYLLDITTIKSLKIINDKEIISVYNIVPNLKNENFVKFIGEKETEKLNKNLNKIVNYNLKSSKIIEGSKDFLIKNFGEKEFNELMDNMLKEELNEQVEENKELLDLTKINCYDRYDNDKFIGYHLDMIDFNLKMGKDSNFVKKLLKDLQYNTDNIDSWLSENRNMDIAWLSFTKINNVENITFYYRDPNDFN